MQIFRGILFVFAFALALAAFASDQVDLKFHPTKGSVMTLKTTLEQKVTQNVNKTDATVAQTLSLTYRITTEDVTDRYTMLKVSYEAVAFKQESPLGNAEYDSDNPPSVIPPVARGFAALVGQSIELKMDAAGRVSDVKGVDSLIEEIIRRLDIPDGPNKPMLEKALRKDFGPEAIRENIESIFLIYPDRLVSIGNSWDHSLAISKGFPIVVDTTYTLKETAADRLALDVSGKLTSKPDVNPVDVGQRKLTYKLSGTEKGTLTLSRADGTIRGGDLTQKVSGTMTVETPDGKSDTPLTIESHIKIDAK